MYGLSEHARAVARNGVHGAAFGHRGAASGVGQGHRGVEGANGGIQGAVHGHAHGHRGDEGGPRGFEGKEHGMQGAEGGREGGCPKGTKKRTLDCFDWVYMYQKVDELNVEGVENAYGIVIEDFYVDELNACADKHTRKNRKKTLRTALKKNYENQAKKAAHISNAGRGQKVRKLTHGRKSKSKPWEPLFTFVFTITMLTWWYAWQARDSGQGQLARCVCVCVPVGWFGGGVDRLGRW